MKLCENSRMLPRDPAAVDGHGAGDFCLHRKELADSPGVGRQDYE